ncbi:MAG: VCBS repeat-containing protein [Chitinophagales bacterium]|nr:VCBS repeat-containing protein [Chitinophagales bacterium]
MKIKHFFTILVALYSIMTATLTVNAQTTFGEQQLIEYTETNTPTDAHAADLDGDGDMDVLSASYIDNKIAWYENDGNGNFGLQQIITTATNGARSVYAADLDNDGDVDVLSASTNEIK